MTPAAPSCRWPTGCLLFGGSRRQETALGECVAEHDQGTAMSGGYKLPRIFGVNMGRQSPVKKQGCGIYMSCQ